MSAVIGADVPWSAAAGCGCVKRSEPSRSGEESEPTDPLHVAGASESIAELPNGVMRDRDAERMGPRAGFGDRCSSAAPSGAATEPGATGDRGLTARSSACAGSAHASRLPVRISPRTRRRSFADLEATRPIRKRAQRVRSAISTTTALWSLSRMWCNPTPPLPTAAFAERGAHADAIERRMHEPSGGNAVGRHLRLH